MVVLIGALGGCTGLMSTSFWAEEERYEMSEQARVEAEYEMYVDDCAQADEPALSMASWLADCRRRAAERAVTEPAPAFEADDDICF